MIKNPELVGDLLKKIRSLTPLIVGVKLSPDQSNEDLLTMAKIVKQYPNTYLTIGNTSYKKCSQVGLQEHDISIGGGGLSGPPLFKRTLEMITLLSDQGLPLIATGGMHSVDTAKQALAAGATLVGMASGLVMDPFCVPKINQELQSATNQ